MTPPSPRSAVVFRTQKPRDLWFRIFQSIQTIRIGDAKLNSLDGIYLNEFQILFPCVLTKLFIIL
jgi:hypothetical protein